MLTIIVREIALERRWILHGRLTDCFVAEVLSNWYASKDHQSSGPRIIDLDGAFRHRQKRRANSLNVDSGWSEIRRGYSPSHLADTEMHERIRYAETS
jgi:hypothetical protein